MNTNKNQGGTATEPKNPADERNRDRNQGGTSQGDGWKQGSDPNRRPDQGQPGNQPRSEEKKVPGLDDDKRNRDRNRGEEDSPADER